MEIVKTRRTSVIILALLLLACMPMIWAQLGIWQREYTGNEFSFHYRLPPEFSGFSCNTWSQYTTKTDAVELIEGKTWIMIEEQTYTNPWNGRLLIDFTLTTEAVGAELVVEGRYLLIRPDSVIDYAGDAFNIPTDPQTPFLLDASLMTWEDLLGGKSLGRGLELTISIDSSGIEEAETGDYTYNYDVTVGIIPDGTS